MKRLPLLLLLVVASFLSVAHALESVPKGEYHSRRVALAEKMPGGVAVLFAATEPVLDFMSYRQDEDFYYLTGWNEPGAAIVLIAAAPAEAEAPGRDWAVGRRRPIGRFCFCRRAISGRKNIPGQRWMRLRRA